MSDTQKDQALFIHLIISFQAAAMQQMGKIKNPYTDKVEKDMKQAQTSIDMIDMLKQKTEGNLNDEEAKYLEQALRELRLNYLDEFNKQEPDTEKDK